MIGGYYMFSDFAGEVLGQAMGSAINGNPTRVTVPGMLDSIAYCIDSSKPGIIKFSVGGMGSIISDFNFCDLGEGYYSAMVMLSLAGIWATVTFTVQNSDEVMVRAFIGQLS